MSKELIKVANVFTLTSRLIPNLTAIFSFSCSILDSHRRTPHRRKCQPSAYKSSLLIKAVILSILQFLLGSLLLTVCKHCCAHWTAPFQGTPTLFGSNTDNDYSLILICNCTHYSCKVRSIYWNRVLRAVVVSLFWEVFKKRLGVMLSGMV